MPKISLWRPNKGADYFFSDKIAKEYINMGGTGVYLHKYVGPASGGKETTISDVLFLENRSRKYDNDVYELRGAYNPATTDLNLGQFAYLAANDTILITFHLNDMLDIVGRKIMSGDVLELPHLADSATLDPDLAPTVRFYAVTDSVHEARGYGNQWWSHIWQVKAKQIINSSEYNNIKPAGSEDANSSDLPDYLKPGNIINGDGDVVATVCCDNPNSTLSKELEISDGIVAEAYANVRFDPKQYDTAHLWIQKTKDGYMCGKKNMFDEYPWSGDGLPPTGKELSGTGDEFPTNLVDGDFFLRTDFDTPRLFMKEGNIWRLIEADMRKIWTGYNKVLDGFIDSVETDTMTDGEVVKVRKALSQVVKPKKNLHKPKEDDINGDPH